MNYKKITQIVVIIIAGVWIFCISMIIGVHQVRKKQSTDASLFTTAPAITAFAPATMPETTAQTTTSPPISIDGNNAATTVPDVGDPDWLIAEKESEQASIEASEKAELEKNVPKTKADIITAYVNAVNKLKNTDNFTVVKTEKLTMTIDELTGGDTIRSIADKLIEQNSPGDPVTYTFKNGIAQETGEEQAGKSPNQVIPPMGLAASVDESFVKTATATAGTDGGYTLRLTFNSETQTLDTPAQNYTSVMEVIELESLGLPSGTNLESLSIVYDNSYIEASIDSSGQITYMKHYMEVTSAEGSGKYLIIPVNMKSHGSFSTDYEIKY